MSISHTALTPKDTANSFYNGELEADIRAHGLLDSTVFMRDSDREKHMERLADIRKHCLYPHETCSETCRKRDEIIINVISEEWVKVSLDHD